MTDSTPILRLKRHSILILPFPSSDAQMELLDDEDATAAKEAQQEKVRAALEGLWAKYDADGNGELSGDELELLMKGYFENAEEVRSYRI